MCCFQNLSLIVEELGRCVVTCFDDGGKEIKW